MSEDEEKKQRYGFVMLRHVHSEETNKYWIESYKSIRKYYDHKIVIIDDNSDYAFVKNDGIDESEIVNCTVIQSEYPARGEILGYYYYYVHHFFEKAVILHDSAFINQYIDFDQYDKIKFIWHFDRQWFSQPDETFLLENITNPGDEPLARHYDNPYICGIFGLQSVVSHAFLTTLEQKYKIFDLLEHITCRNERMNLERVFAIVAIDEYNDIIHQPSILGPIHTYIYRSFTYSFGQYIHDKEHDKEMLDRLPIVKVWSGR
jgi:hypothetical protein